MEAIEYLLACIQLRPGLEILFVEKVFAFVFGFICEDNKQKTGVRGKQRMSLRRY